MEISFALMSGGEGKRFGSDKTKAIFRDKPLYACGLELGKKVSRDVMHVSKEPRKYEPFINGVSYIKDELEERCPMAGMITAARHAKNRLIFMLSADAPLFTADIIGYLCDNIGDKDAIIPEINGRLYPLSALYKTDILKSFTADYDRGNYKIIKALERYDMKKITEKELITAGFDLNAFTNINYAEDLARLNEKHIKIK